MLANEFLRGAPFFLEKSGFSQLGIPMHLFIARDAIQLAGMLIVDRIVSHPQFEGEIRTNRNKTMKLYGVANGPWKTHKDGEANDQYNMGKPPALGRTDSKINPDQQKWED